MMTLLQEMPAEARTWVYAANRKLTAEEKAQVTAKARHFTDNWTAHEKQLKASFAILYDVFLVLMVDEHFNEVSGCGIDKSVAFFKQLEADFGISLFNRMQIEVLEGDEVIITDKAGVAAMIAENRIGEDSTTFNKTVTDKRQFDEQFSVPVSKAWFFSAVQNSLARG